MDREKIVLEKEYEDISVDELRAELPEREPRFVVYIAKYVRKDGQVIYPLCFIHSSPVGSRPDHLMRYAGSRDLLAEASEINDVFETRNTDDLTEEWLRNKFAYLG
ncbi:Glia maturation factor gamma [Liparis tanakae]|uniref:Glia maturation factor n=1 Tax=Liparis tanakae TaxID=230148 RepID=A0A4Z2EAR2_9TELE|nr:Glia maturation factor gamma [Liparis tanakae]